MTKCYIKIFILLLLFVPFRMQAQIKPFEDYSKCMAGFLKSNGDTLYPAQFENIQQVPLFGYYSTRKDKPAWIVDFSGRKGCIDGNGKWIFECKYSIITYFPESKIFMVKKDGLSGAYQENGEEILSCQFTSLALKVVTGSFSYFDAETKDYDRVYGMNGKPLTPECRGFNSYFLPGLDSIIHFKNYFVFHKKEVNGLSFSGVSDETGKEYPIAFQGIEPLLVEGQTAEDELLFLVMGDNDKLALANKNGTLQTRFFGPDSHIKPVPFVETGSKYLTYHHAVVEFSIKEHSKAVVLDLRNRAESEMYDEVVPFGDYFVAYRKNEAFVLDKDLKMVFQTPTKTQTLSYCNAENGRISTINHWYTPASDWNEYERQYVGSQKAYEQSDEVILLSSKEWGSKKAQKNHEVPILRYQLIQAKTGKLIEKKYADVVRAMSKDGVYLWASDQQKGDSVFMDIYSFDGTFQRSFTCDLNQYNELMKQLRYSGRNSFEPLAWIQNSEGKYKAVHHDGTSVTPYAFENKSSVVFSKGKWVFCDNDRGEGVFYDALHRTLFNGEEVRRFFQFRNRESFYVQTEKNGYLLNAGFEVFADSVLWVNFINTINVLKMQETSIPVCQRGEFCYAVLDGRLRLLDSTMFLNPQKINQLDNNSLKIEASGKLYKEEKRTKKESKEIKDIIGNLQLVLLSGKLTVTNKTTQKVVNVIENVESFKYAGERNVFIQLTTKKQGLINFETGKWVIEPKYTEVNTRFLMSSEKEGFWARNEDQNDGKWFSLDATGKIRTQAIFDEPVYPYSLGRYQLMPFKSYGKIGLINENFKIVAQPIFDKYVFQDNIRAYFKDDKPYLVFPNGKMMEIRHPISDAYVSKNFLFLYNDSIEVISNEGTVLLPAMPLEKAMKTYLLAEYLFSPPKNKRTFPYISNDHVFCAPTDLAMLYYSNHVFIDDIRGSMKEVKDLATPRPMSLSYTFRIQCDVEPTWISKNLCSERVHGKCFPESAYKRQDFDGGSGYRVYKIMKDTCIQLRLEDLIKDDAVAQQKLDDLIRIEIQKKQSFGLVCADMEGAIAAFKSDFSVDQQYLFMRNQGLTEYLAIPIRDLKEVLRNPEWFN